MKAGPSYSTDEKEAPTTPTATTNATDNSDDSSISSDEFSSTYSSSETSSRDEKKSPPVTKQQGFDDENLLTSAFRKTCDILKDLLEKRRLKMDEKTQTDDDDNKNG